MYIFKASGEKEEFDRKKVERTAIRAGASEDFAKKVAKKVERQINNGDDTKKILNLVLKFLREKPEIAEKYSLKKAIMELGPAGFLFEDYFARVLQEYGYTTQVRTYLQGKTVKQEIDVLAIKDKIKNMIECKYHNSMGKRTDLKVAMYTHARFLDVKKYVDCAWLVTNTKCTPTAIQYSKGVNLKIIGWNYPSKGSLQELVEEKKLYPVTSLLSARGFVKERLAEAKIILAKDLVNLDIKELETKTRLSKQTIINLKKDSENLINAK